MKKLFLIVLSLALSIGLFGCEINKEYRDENFIYNYQTYMNQNIIHLEGLTDEGKQKKYLYVPGRFKGWKVVIRSASILTDLVSLQSDELEKLYVSVEISTLGDLIAGENAKVFVISNKINFYSRCKCNYVTSKRYYEINNDKNYSSINLAPANVSYIYNYEDAPNDGYYFIDDCNNELIEFVPDDPEREGYTFKGWYKEAECASKWDFEIDIIPEKDNEEDFIETKLYAKWDKAKE